MNRTLKGLLALATILVLVVGIPVGLYVAGGAPWPTQLPSWHRVTGALTSPDDGTAFLGVLKALGWLAWLSFAAMVLVEVGARLRGVGPPRIPALGLQQRAAAGLVGAAAVLFAVAAPALLPAPAHGAIETPAPGIVQVHGPGVQQTPEAQVAAEAPAPAANVPVVGYTVQPGDSLYSIAEAQLGSGERFAEIAALNYGVLQADGASLTPSHWLQPGWTLQVPVAEQDVHVTVHPGDTLSSIAQQELGDSARYDELFEASTATEQPGGAHLTDPDLIRPGWTITVPHAEAAPAAPAPTHHDAVNGATPAVAPEQPAHTGLPTAMVAEARAHRDAAPEAASIDQGMVQSGLPGSAGAAVGIVLAAGLAGALGLRQGRRQAAEAPSIPDPEGALIQQIRDVADTPTVAVVDRALRALARSCADERRPLPAVRAARLVGHRFDLLLDGPAVLPTPWVDAGGADVWSLATAGDRLPSAEEVADTPAPYPALVTVGHDTDGGLRLLDLAYVDVLGVVGPPARTRAALAALAAELATGPWSGGITLSLVGFGDLAALPGDGRLHHHRSVADLLAAGLSAGAGLHVVLLAESARPDRDRLVDAVGGAAGVALVAATPEPLGPWSLALGDDGTAVVEPLGMAVRPQALDDPTYARLVGLLTATAPSAERTRPRPALAGRGVSSTARPGMEG